MSVNVETVDGIAVVTPNRPAQFNALDLATARARRHARRFVAGKAAGNHHHRRRQGILRRRRHPVGSRLPDWARVGLSCARNECSRCDHRDSPQGSSDRRRDQWHRRRRRILARPRLRFSRHGRDGGPPAGVHEQRSLYRRRRDLHGAPPRRTCPRTQDRGVRRADRRPTCTGVGTRDADRAP